MPNENDTKLHYDISVMAKLRGMSANLLWYIHTIVTTNFLTRVCPDEKLVRTSLQRYKLAKMTM